MPWPYLPEEHLRGNASTWVTASNALHDPMKAEALYARYLDELVYYDEVGFDGVCVNEHHQTPYGQMPAPNVVAGLLVPRTRGKIAILGNAISLRQNPLRVAEEVALLDCVSGGRIISGFVRGIGAEYHSLGLDPTESRDRFYEAHDLIIKAWTEPGPFEWYGKYFKYRYVNPWPLTYQKPHPEIWSPTLGSGETVDWAAKNHYTFLQTFNSIENVRRIFGQFQEATRGYGYECPSHQLGWAVLIYVADTNEEARREAKPAVEWLFNVGLRMPKEFFFPAGYLSLDSAMRVMAAKAGLGTSAMTYEYLEEKEYVIVGSPETVRQKLEGYHKELNVGTLSADFQFGTLQHEQFMKSVTLFADKVLPAIRPLGEPAGREALVS